MIQSLGRIPFLTARWSNLALLTYRLPREMLQPLVPPGCELDLIDGEAFASLVAFDFLDTRVLGVRWPGFVNFPEVNLRFYVRYRDKLGEHRGVSFVREFVPQRLVALIARVFYNEPYLGVPMTSRITTAPQTIRLDHAITFGGRQHTLQVTASAQTVLPSTDSTEHFFKEHEWGFGTSRGGKLIRYQVAHPQWEIHPVQSFNMDWDFEAVYGSRFAAMQKMEPMSVIVAVGSAVKVFPRGSIAASPIQQRTPDVRELRPPD
jgi:uncharacterized protein YqjF (DUF2071 family)